MEPNPTTALTPLPSAWGDKLDWIERAFPQLQRYIAEYASEESQRLYLEALKSDGLLDTHVDLVTGVRLFQVELVAIMLGDFTAHQLRRLQQSGTIGDQEAFRLKNLVDSLFKLNKIATEMEEAAVFSRRSRAEHGMGNADAFTTMLEEIARGEAIPEGERMTVFLQGGVVRTTEGNEDQLALTEDPTERPLTEDEMAELSSDPRGAA